MTLTVDPERNVPDLTRLTFDRTLDRRLLHRHALCEVFLTDFCRLDGAHYLAGAQLPPIHPYYTDHAQPEVVDPLLLLECARQAETYGGHVQLGVPLGTSFILRRWSLSLRGIGAERNHAPTALHMMAHTRGARYIDARLRAVTYVVHLLLGASPIGEVEIEVAYLPAEAYRAVRVRRRAGVPPPTSANVPPPRCPDRTPVAPERVGRVSAANVVLFEPVLGNDAVEAVIRVPVGNPSMFDHPQDHLPGMVMMEAARQLGILVLGIDRNVPPRQVFLVGFEASFSNYAELDEPTTVRARRNRDTGPDLVDGRERMRVTFHQRGETIAGALLTFVTAPEVR